MEFIHSSHWSKEWAKKTMSKDGDKIKQIAKKSLNGKQC